MTLQQSGFEEIIEEGSRLDRISSHVVEQTWRLLSRIEGMVRGNDGDQDEAMAWSSFRRSLGELGEGCESVYRWARALCTAKRRREAKKVVERAQKGVLNADKALELCQATWMSTCRSTVVNEYLHEIPAYLRFNYKPKCIETDAREAPSAKDIPAWAMWPAPLVFP